MTAPRAVERVRPPKGPYVVVNKVMRWMLSDPRRARRVGEHLLLLHLRGRKTGRLITVPVAYRRQADGTLLVLTNSPWRVNLRGGAPAVTLTLRGNGVEAAAELIEEPSAVSEIYHRLIDEVGHAKVGRRMGIRINVDRMPTVEELAEAVRHDGLSVVRLHPVYA